MADTTASTVLTPAQIATCARKVGFSGQNLVTAIAIALAESGGDAANISPANSDGSHDVGLWQINNKAHPTYFVTGNDAMQDPYLNAAAAFVISGAGSNFGPWSTYDASSKHPHNNASYRDFIAQAKAATTASTSDPANTYGTPPNDPAAVLKDVAAGNSPTGILGTIESIPAATTAGVTSALSSSLSGLEAVGSFFSKLTFITSVEFWKRAGIVALGVTILVFGFILMLGSNKDVQHVAETAALA